MHHYLEEVSYEYTFILGNRRITNLYDLLKEFKSISDTEFSYYASENHNYFADWIEKVIKHQSLAKKLRQAPVLEVAIKVLEEEIRTLEAKEEAKDLSSKDTKKLEEGMKFSQVDDTEEVQEKKPVKLSKKDQETVAIHELEEMLRKISQSENDVKAMFWKHFQHELHKEFIFGLVVGIIMGLIFAMIFLK